MDCEKFDDALMDELYGELDEVTSAALRRHASSCPRCAERLGSMRATRKVLASSFGPVDPPADLEEKILAAAAEARKVVPIRSRMTHFVSVAGRWAMRPQTAMAAVFLLMIGSSVVLMRGSSKSMSPVVVTERGAPADVAPEPAASVADNTKEYGGTNAHGIEQSAAKMPAGAATATATATPNAEAKVATATTPAAAASAMGPIAMMDKKSESQDPTGFDDARQRGAAPRTAAREETRPPAKPSQQPSPPPAAAPAEVAAASPVVAAAPGAPAAPPALGKGSSATGTGSGAGGATPADSTSPFADAMAAYRAQRYPEATRGFDALAQQGDPNAALWAARSELRSSGCASAVGRFDRIVASSYGTSAGYDAALEAGRCYRALGSFDVARARFQRLLTVPSHAARAQAELDAMSPKSKRAAPGETL